MSANFYQNPTPGKKHLAPRDHCFFEQEYLEDTEVHVGHGKKPFSPNVQLNAAIENRFLNAKQIKQRNCLSSIVFRDASNIPNNVESLEVIDASADTKATTSEGDPLENATVDVDGPVNEVENGTEVKIEEDDIASLIDVESVNGSIATNGSDIDLIQPVAIAPTASSVNGRFFDDMGAKRDVSTRGQRGPYVKTSFW